MMTQKELHDEFWLLTKGILQDSRIDTDEARVLKRWIEEHQLEKQFNVEIGKLAEFLADGYVGRIESSTVCSMIGNVLVRLSAME